MLIFRWVFREKDRKLRFLNKRIFLRNQELKLPIINLWKEEAEKMLPKLLKPLNRITETGNQELIKACHPVEIAKMHVQPIEIESIQTLKIPDNLPFPIRTNLRILNVLSVMISHLPTWRPMIGIA